MPDSDEEVVFDLSTADPDYDPNADPEFAPAPPVPEIGRDVLGFIAKRRLLTMDALYNQPPIEWFIEDLLPYMPRTMLQGAGGSFKSFLVLDWMLCAATGRAWFGRTVRPGKVLYMAGEGARGLPKRIDAWCAHNDVERAAIQNIDFMGEPFELGAMSSQARDLWRAFIAHLGYDYIVVDTLHTASGGAEENSNTDMGRVLDTMTYIAGGANGAATIYVHHRSKANPGARGASALRDDFDVTIELAPTSELYQAKLSKDKIRDVEEFKPLLLKFERHRPEDRLHSSLYIEQVEDTDTSKTGPKAGTRTSQVQLAAEAITHHDLLHTGWGEAQISEELKRLDLGYKFSPSTVGRALRQLRESQAEIENMNRRRNNQEDDDDSATD